MNDVLSIDQMAGLFYLVQEASDIVVPVVQYVIGELALQEHDDPLHPVDLRSQPLVHDHIPDLHLSSLHADPDQRREPVQSDPAIVLLNHYMMMLLIM